MIFLGDLRGFDGDLIGFHGDFNYQNWYREQVQSSFCDPKTWPSWLIQDCPCHSRSTLAHLFSFSWTHLQNGLRSKYQPGRAEGWADVGSIHRWFECGRCLNESNVVKASLTHGSCRRWMNYSNPCNPTTPRTQNFNLVSLVWFARSNGRNKSKPKVRNKETET